PTQTVINTLKHVEKRLNRYDMIIQTTSVGMYPNTEKTVISCHNLKAGSVASDIVYRPLTTAFLKQAQLSGAQIFSGHTMLLYHAQLACELWTGTSASVSGGEDQLQVKLEACQNVIWKTKTTATRPG